MKVSTVYEVMGVGAKAMGLDLCNIVEKIIMQENGSVKVILVEGYFMPFANGKFTEMTFDDTDYSYGNLLHFASHIVGPKKEM